MKQQPAQVPGGLYGVTVPSSRVQERFPVTLFYRNGGNKDAQVRGTAEGFDLHSLNVTADAAIPAHKKVKVRFVLPASMTTVYNGVPCELAGEVLKSAKAGGKGDPRCELELKWEAPLPQLIESSLSTRSRRIALGIFLVLAAMLWMRWTTMAFFWYDPVFYLYTTIIGTYYFSRFYLADKHRPPAWTGAEPTISIVCSVRNEEGAIESTVDSCYTADYPPEKLDVAVVNDGSTDATPQILEKVQMRYPQLKVFHIPPSGKRVGMATGIRATTGEIVVVLDSDTHLDRMALRHIVCGFEDPTLAAVSGYTDVANAEKNLLTRMQQVRYRMSYELMKAPESLYGCVTCCPGSLSAYRRKYLVKVLDGWLAQRFLGAPATFGDDRSLTNRLLKDYRIIYNPNAHSSTLVPETWVRYLTQQTRWKKSWIREFLVAGRFMWRKHPVAALSYYASAICSLMSPFMVLRAFWWSWAGDGSTIWGYLIGLVFLGLTMALFTVWKRPSRYWYLSWLLVGLQVVIMGPQTYYAMLTMRKTHWGTR